MFVIYDLKSDEYSSFKSTKVRTSKEPFWLR